MKQIQRSPLVSAWRAAHDHVQARIVVERVDGIQLLETIEGASREPLLILLGVVVVQGLRECFA